MSPWDDSFIAKNDFEYGSTLIWVCLCIYSMLIYVDFSNISCVILIHPVYGCCGRAVWCCFTRERWGNQEMAALWIDSCCHCTIMFLSGKLMKRVTNQTCLLQAPLNIHSSTTYGPSTTTPRLSVEEGDGVIQRLFQRVEGLFDLQVMPLEELIAGASKGTCHMFHVGSIAILREGKKHQNSQVPEVPCQVFFFFF